MQRTWTTITHRLAFQKHQTSHSSNRWGHGLFSCSAMMWPAIGAIRFNVVNEKTALKAALNTRPRSQVNPSAYTNTRSLSHARPHSAASPRPCGNRREHEGASGVRTHHASGINHKINKDTFETDMEVSRFFLPQWVSEMCPTQHATPKHNPNWKEGGIVFRQQHMTPRYKIPSETTTAKQRLSYHTAKGVEVVKHRNVPCQSSCAEQRVPAPRTAHLRLPAAALHVLLNVMQRQGNT